MQTPEIILNLWYLVDKDSGIVLQLAARAYLTTGTDAEKTALLRALSRHDYLAAQWQPVPSRFHVNDHAGYTTAQGVRDNTFGVFADLLTAIQQEIHPQLRYINGEGEALPIPFPEDPLCVLTPLMEDETGLVQAITK